MTRTWDWIVALTMIVLGCLVQTIVSLCIALPIVVGIDSMRGIESMWVMYVTWAGVFLILNIAGFFDYYYFHRVNRAGVFHLLPRAIERIVHGQELPNAVDGITGQPIDVQAPVHAGSRLSVGLAVAAISIAAIFFGANHDSPFSAVAIAAGAIVFLVGAALILQAGLAYVGVMRRKVD